MVQFIDKPMPAKATPKFIDTPMTGGVNFIDTNIPKSNGLSIWQKAGSFGVGVAQGVSDVGQFIIGNPVGYISGKIAGSMQGSPIQQALVSGAKKLFGEQAVQQFQQSEQAKMKQPGYNPTKSNIITDTNLLTPEQQQSGWASGGREVGKFIGTTALTAPIGGIIGAGGKALGMGSSMLGRVGIGALQGAGQTQVSNLGSEGKFASVGETLLGAGLAGGINALGEAGTAIKKGLYNKAFSQTKKSISEKGYELSGKTPGQLVMDQNLSPSVKKGITEIKDKLQNTWTKVEETADKAGKISGIGIRGGLKKDMREQLGFDKLPQGAKSTKELVKKVSNIVDDYIPTGKITGREMVQQIKNLNKTLPDKLVGMGIGDPTSSKGFTQALEKGMKKVLDTKAEQGGAGSKAITELYKDYGKQKTVQAILKDENLRKTLGRQIVGSSVGAGLGGISGYEDIKKGDIIGGGLKIIGGAIAGNTATRLATNPTVLMKLGNVASKWLSDASNIKKTITSFLSSKMK